MQGVMDKLKTPLGEYPDKNESYTAVIATDRQAIIDLLDESPNNYFEITMPCGYSQRFEKHADIPVEDLPCQCDGFNRYLIRYEKE